MYLCGNVEGKALTLFLTLTRAPIVLLWREDVEDHHDGDPAIGILRHTEGRDEGHDLVRDRLRVRGGARVRVGVPVRVRIAPACCHVCSGADTTSTMWPPF